MHTGRWRYSRANRIRGRIALLLSRELLAHTRALVLRLCALVEATLAFNVYLRW